MHSFMNYSPAISLTMRTNSATINFCKRTEVGLTWRKVRRFVTLLVGAHSSAVEQCVQGLFLSAAGQAAQPLGARPRVHAARLALGKRARQAAATARLLHELAAHRHRGTHGQRFLVTGFARHIRAEAAGQPQDERGQEGRAHQHVPSL